MLLEFQIGAAKLRAILLGRIRAQTICVAHEFAFGGDTYILDHIDIPDSGTFARQSQSVTIHVPGSSDVAINGTKVRFNQPAILNIVKKSTLAANGAGKSAPDLSLQIMLSFDLTMSVSAGIPRFRVQLAAVDAGQVAAIDTDAGNLILNMLAFDVHTDMDLAPIASLVETAVAATNAGMVVDVGLSRIAMRIEINGVGNSSAGWLAFFTGPVPDHLGTKEWSMLIDAGLMVPAVVSRISAGMAGSKDFSLQKEPVGVWSWLAGPEIDVYFSGEVVDACNCFFWSIDVDVDVTIQMRMSIPQADLLQMDAYVSHDSNDAEVFCCAVTNAAFWPVVGLALLSEDKIGWDAYLGGLALGPVGTFISTIVMASTATSDLAVGGACSKISDNHVRCEQGINISAGLGSLAVDAISGLPEGPLLQGTMFVPPPVGTPEITTSASAFSWKVEGGCNRGFQIANSAGISITNSGHAPIQVCDVAVVDDPLGVYEASLHVITSGMQYDVGVYASVTDAFLAAPYKCKVMIKTNGGARLVTLSAPAQISPDEQQQLGLGLLVSRANCYKAIDSFYGATGRMKPDWLIDPPPQSLVEHLWQVLATGLQPGDKVVATRQDGQVAAVATAGKRGAAQLSVITAPAAIGEDELVLAHVAAGAPAQVIAEEQRQLVIKQVLLVRSAAFNLVGHAVAIGSGYMGQAPLVYTVDSGGLRVYDCGTLAAPFLAQSMRTQGLRGAVLWHGSLAVWGEQGLTLLAEGESRVGFGQAVFAGPVRDAVRVGDHLAVLSDDGVHMMGSDLVHTTSPAHGATYLIPVGQRMWLGSAEGIDLFDPIRPVLPRRAGTYALSGMPALRAPASADAKDVLFAPRDSGGGAVLEIGPNGLVELARYEADPWYIGGARVGKTIGRLIDRGTKLAIYTIAGSVER